MVERGGEVITRSVKDRKARTLMPTINEHVRKRSRIATDELKAYNYINEVDYTHRTVNHSAKEYVRRQIHTNTIEAFWAWLKRGIEGTHVWVSEKHLPKYLAEFEYRFNLRHRPDLMFDLLLSSFARPSRVVRREP